ncbi:hypothetical protein, partial [Pseudoalteromonas spongiae]|uniref:hypothetical protein n=1 Tax=Pseudoalteromonas spongiae TaxID=298657 RepID=UPI001283BFCD
MNKIKPFLHVLLLIVSILISRQVYASSEEVLIENFNLTKQSLGQSVGRLGSKFIYKVNTQQYGDELWSF